MTVQVAATMPPEVKLKKYVFVLIFIAQQPTFADFTEGILIF